MIAEDVKARLAALGVPVLLPHELERVLAAGEGERPGIPGYLEREAPQGYVQIQNPIPIRAGVVEAYWVSVDCLAPDGAVCALLTRDVFHALCGVPGRAPGHYAPQPLGHPPQLMTDGYWLSRQTVQAALIGDQPI